MKKALPIMAAPFCSRTVVSARRGCDFTHPFATNGSIRLPRVQRKALNFDSAKISPERKLNHPFAESTNCKQPVAKSTKLKTELTFSCRVASVFVKRSGEI